MAHIKSEGSRTKETVKRRERNLQKQLYHKYLCQMSSYGNKTTKCDCNDTFVRRVICFCHLAETYLPSSSARPHQKSMPAPCGKSYLPFLRSNNFASCYRDAHHNRPQLGWSAICAAEGHTVLRHPCLRQRRYSDEQQSPTHRTVCGNLIGWPGRSSRLHGTRSPHPLRHSRDGRLLSGRGFLLRENDGDRALVRAVAGLPGHERGPALLALASVYPCLQV